MNERIITDISDFIFVSDEPQKVDAVFLRGGSHPERPEYAAKLYNKGFAIFHRERSACRIFRCVSTFSLYFRQPCGIRVSQIFYKAIRDDGNMLYPHAVSRTLHRLKCDICGKQSRYLYSVCTILLNLLLLKFHVANTVCFVI